MEDKKFYTFYKNILIYNLITSIVFSNIMYFFNVSPETTQLKYILFIVPVIIKLILLISLIMVVKQNKLNENIRLAIILCCTTLYFNIDAFLYNCLSPAIIYLIIPIFIITLMKNSKVVKLETIVTAIFMAIYLVFLKFKTMPFKSNIITNSLALLAVFSQLLLIIKKIEDETLSMNAKSNFFKDKSKRDGMTGLYNNRTFYEVVSEKVQLIAPFCIIIIDIDNFKKANDTYGHPFGDIVLKTLVKTIKKTIRDKDIAFRYGGEEFAVVFPKTTADEAFEIAENIRRNFSLKTFNNTEWSKTKIPFAVSIGLVENSKRGAIPQEIINNCDQALYQSKQNGKNQTTIYQD
jgi:diguanylate cyclase (GGDEF)-like protein